MTGRCSHTYYKMSITPVRLWLAWGLIRHKSRVHQEWFSVAKTHSSPFVRQLQARSPRDHECDDPLVDTRSGDIQLGNRLRSDW